MITIQEIKTDDMDGKTKVGVETHTIELDGQAFEIELGRKSYAQLKRALALYMQKGRRVTRRSGTRPPARGRRRVPVRPDTPQVRAWALEQGIDGVRQLGRLAAGVYDRYDARNGTS